MKQSVKNGTIKILLVIVMAIFVEVLIFNYQHFWSSDVNHKVVDFDECVYGSEYYVMEGEDGGDLLVLWSEFDIGCGFLIPVSQNVNNIAIYAYGKGARVLLENNKGEGIRELDSASLELNIYGYREKDSSLDVIYSGVLSCDNDSLVYNLPDNRGYDGLYLHFGTIEDYYVVVENVELNIIPSISFNCIRFFIILILCATVVFYKELKILLQQKNSLYFALGLSFIVGILFASMTFLNPITTSDEVPIDAYNDLAESIVNGKVTVYDEYAGSLDILSDVYNYEERLESGLFYITDFAYYNGHYYVYFGIVPCLLLYVPYMLLTGERLFNSLSMAIIIFFLCIGIGKLLYELIDRYFEKSTKIGFIYAYFVVAFMAQIPSMIAFPLVYQIAQCSGLAFVVWGLSFYVKAGGNKNTTNECQCIVMGSLLIALAVGCRPQLGILAFLAFPLLKKKMLAKDIGIIRYWCSFFIPYIIVAVFLMYYNYLRFDNMFEFGAKYNLTDDTIYKTTVYWEKVVVGFKYMFTDIPMFSRRFPYVDFYMPDYEIDRLVKETTGGFFLVNLLALVALFPIRSKLSDRNELWIMQYELVVFSIFIGVINVICGGCIQRYKLDFAIWLGLATTMASLGLLNTYRNKWVRVILAAGLLISIVTNSSLYFYGDALSLIDYDKALFQDISRSIIFWS